MSEENYTYFMNNQSDLSNVSVKDSGNKKKMSNTVLTSMILF